MAVDKKNIFLSIQSESIGYASKSRPIPVEYPKRDTKSHALLLKNKLNACYTDKQRIAAAIKYKNDTYLEFSSKPGFPLKLKSLENIREGVRLLNVHEDQEMGVTKATVFIPEGKEGYFLKKINEYERPVSDSKEPKNNELISSIEDVKLALLESFWFGNKNTIPNEVPCWCEIWLRTEPDLDSCGIKSFESELTQTFKECDIETKDGFIKFPERLVKLIRANKSSLTKLIEICSYVAEIRIAPTATSTFSEMHYPEQKEWSQELLSRSIYSNHNNISICLLDTGVNYSHPLLSPSINPKHVQTINQSWGTGDTKGHGSEMAGIALFNNLKEALESSEHIEVTHNIESVKILPTTGANPPELYGDITQRAVYLAEIANPTAKRVNCMAITAPDDKCDGTPSSWSAAIDNIVFDNSYNNSKRLFLISAGNLDFSNEFKYNPYPDANRLHSVENPGQAWNAITVGAYTEDVCIDNIIYKDCEAIAESGNLSPLSSTSQTWNKNKPIKPEVLFNGGNIAKHKSDFYTECPDLALLTTYFKPLEHLFTTTQGTSPSTAQAAWFCAKLLNEYPNAWPETIRALMIHSASWTTTMKSYFCNPDTKNLGRQNLLRCCGYGIPNLSNAIQCMNNNVNMIIQDEIQPFTKGKKMNEMRVYTLPWPKDVLESLGETRAKLKVTLSYFVEPGPGEIGWKDKYRYPSCLLRFDVNNTNESLLDFEKRINTKMRENNENLSESSSASERWYLGTNNRNVGSIHSDFIEMNAIDLCNCNHIAVYPVVGWWRERGYLKRYNNKIRYSLIVSLSTPAQNIDLYSPIVAQIQIPTEVQI